MARRKRSPSNDGSDDDWSPSSEKPKTKLAKRQPKPPPTKAEVISRATDTAPDQADIRDRVNKIDSAVIGRIKKALALATHEETGEDEARAALRMASKLLERHNVTQAEIMSQETDSEKLKRAGISIVSIKSTAVPPLTVKREGWTSILGGAMTVFFDCQSYHTTFTSNHRVDWSFYGLAEQTVTAAHAFEMTYNLILAWSLEDKIPKGIHNKNAYRRGVAHGLRSLAHKEKAAGEEMAAQKEQALLEAKKLEEAELDKKRIERLDGPVKAETYEEGTAETVKGAPGGKVELGDAAKEECRDFKVKIEEVEDEDMSSSKLTSANEADGDMDTWMPEDFSLPIPDFDELDDNDDSDDSDDNDEDCNGPGAAEPRLKSAEAVLPPLPDLLPSSGGMHPPASTVPLREQRAKDEIKEEPDLESPWDSVGALVAFRASSMAIGDDFLKSRGIDLKKGRPTARFQSRGEEAIRLFKQGEMDAQKIDVKRKQIKGADDH